MVLGGAEMRRSFVFASLLPIFWLLLNSGWAGAAEHPGKAVEHPGRAINADFVKKSIENHVKAEEKANKGFFLISDPDSNRSWRLTLIKIHDPVRQFEKDGQMIYFACSDFKSGDSEDILDIDFWMIQDGKRLKVIDTKIHKLNGKAKFNYEGIEVKPIP